MGETKKICIVVSSAEKTMQCFLLDHLKALSYKYTVFASANTDNFDFIDSLDRPIKTFSNRIERKISIWRDIRALLHLCRIFRQYRFDAVHSVSPKAGLLTMAAGLITRVPIRIHTFTGQVWMTRRGLHRWMLRNIDKLISLMATDILVDSYSQLSFLLKEKIVSSERSTVLAKGSITGVDTQRFSENLDMRQKIRRKFNISESNIVFLFLGRLTRDKGVIDLFKAFVKLYELRKNIHLLIVGSDEDGITKTIKGSCGDDCSHITIIGQTSVPEEYMAASDILCLPSYREGFGNVIIEAASVGIPAIGSRIYGIIDAIEEGITGLLHEPGDESSLLNAMLVLADNQILREEMGKKAHNRALLLFSKEEVTKALVNYYKELL